MVEVKVSLNGESAEVLVEDNGLGIPKDNLDKVFDIFYRADDKYAGSGIGLYIVKETVNKLNGEIEVSSKQGMLTSFRIIFPNKKAELGVN